MGLRTLLARRAVRAAHVLIVEVPGWQYTRMAGEQAVSTRGWRVADSPADADVLLVCGTPGPELRGVLESVWEQMPGPRARVTAQQGAAAGAALDDAARTLLDDASQREEASGRAVDPPPGGGMDHTSDGHTPMDHGGHAHMDHGGHDEIDHDHAYDSDGHGDHAGSDHSGPPHTDDDDSGDHVPMGHEGMDHGGHDHGGMGHGGMDMEPGGIALAEGAPDPDGLDLDVLHVPLGPVLPHWPAGLVLECTMQGDRVAEARARLLDAGEARAQTPADRGGTGRGDAALLCDDAARLLAVAGWDSAAAAARRARDAALAGGSIAQCTGALERLGTRVTRSRSLRWSLRGLTVPDPDGGASDLSAVPGRWLAAARAALGGDASPATETRTISPELLAEHVAGLDVASVRLVVAGIGARIDSTVGSGGGAAHG